MIDKIFIHRHIVLEGKSIELFPQGFNFRDNVKCEIQTAANKDPELGLIVSIQVKIQVVVTNDYYDFKTVTEFIITGEPNFKNEDLQRLAEMCLIAYHHTGQYFASSRAMTAWNQEKLEQLPLESFIIDIKGGKINIP